MKKIALLLLILTSTTVVTAQQIYLEGGKSSSSFDYKNAQGNELDNLQSTTHSFMAIGYKDQLFTEKLTFAIGTSYAGYGAIGSDDTVGNFMKWDVHYLGLNISLDYALFSIKKASIYLKVGSSAAFFVQGVQTLNNSVIDLKNNDDFDSTLSMMQAGAGFSHPISDNLSFYVQYLYGKSSDTAKGDETLKIESNNISFGLLIDISKKESTEKTSN